VEAALVSIVTVALAEMGDRTQLLSLVLAALYRRPWAILAGIFLATLANHAAAAALGFWLGAFLTPSVRDAVVGAGLLAMASWALKSDQLEKRPTAGRRGAFVATLLAFFIAEIGDKTQIATIALAAGYANLPAVVIGSTSGMLLANAPVVFLGNAYAGRLPLKAIHYGAALLFLALGIVFIIEALARAMAAS
jgi:Ca2+/H+ antiporter, TMEM165/GDT1 family